MFKRRSFIKISILQIFFLLSSLILSFFFLKENINPFNTKWLFNEDDLAMQQIAWYFYKNDIWRFPLGLNPNYGDNINNTIIYSDSIPLFAFFFKFFLNLFKINEINFQYYSIWYYLSFYLQLFFSYKIIYYLTKEKYFSFLSSFLFFFSPIYLFRLSHHATLVGHWIILLGIYLLIIDRNIKWKRYWFFIINLSCFINLYFTFILTIFYLTFVTYDSFKNKKYLSNFIKSFFIFLTLYISMYVSGYFKIRYIDGIAFGFGQYKLNLLSVIDPGNNNGISWSQILPNIQLSALEEDEGFNYFGLGNLLLIFVCFISNITNKNKIISKNNFQFIIISAIFFLLALSNKISLGNIEIINIELNKYLLGMLSIFRASGRLFWPVYYLIIIFSIYSIYKNFEKKIIIRIILILVSIQILDISRAIHDYSKIINNKVNYKNSTLEKFIKKNTKLISINNYNYNKNFSEISFFTEKLRITSTNVINLARVDRSIIAQNRYELNKNLYKKNIETNTIYIIDNLSHLKHLKKIFDKTNVIFLNANKFWIMTASKDSLFINTSNFEKIKNNEKHIFNNNNINMEKYLGLGWSHNAIKGGIWSDGYISSIIFNTEDITKDLVITINCDPYLNNYHKKQYVDIFYKDILLKNYEFNLNDKTTNKIILKIKKELIDSKNIEIILNFRNPGSPSDYFESPDSKKLGILIKDIKINNN